MSHATKPHCRRFVTVIALGLVLGAFPADGQVQLRPGSGPPSIKTDASGESVPVIVVTDKATIRKAPSFSAGRMGTASFLDAYLLVDVAEESGKKLYLAGTREGISSAVRLVGWLAEEDVLTERRALREVPGIYLKGLIINQWRLASSGVGIEGAQVRKGPGESHQLVGEIGLFSIYFVYKKQRAGSNIFYLLGEVPVLTNLMRPQDSLVGWVDGRRLVEWSTRQAAQFDKSTVKKRAGSEGTKLFLSQDELLAHLRGQERIGGKALEPVAAEALDERPWPHYLPRYPIFETQTSTALLTAGSLYHLGFIGDQIFLSGAKGADRETLALNLNRLEGLRKEIRNIDLLFVIDSTGSMRQYFSAAAEAVELITKQVRAEFPLDGQGPDIRYSVVFYRDYVDQDSKPAPDDTYLTKRLPFTGNQAAVASFLKDEERMICDGCGGDEPEAVFYGLDYAISTAAKEVRELGFRAVVLIGDKGNHRTDPRGYTSARAATSIRDANYELYCFHVVEPAVASSDADARAFRDQCSEIENQIEMRSTTKRLSTADPKAIARAIVDAARDLGGSLQKTRDAAKKVSSGEAGLVEIRNQYGLLITQRLSDMMATKGIDPAIFVSRSVQIFDRGWGSELDPFSGARQIEPMLLVDRPDLEQLAGVLAGMTKEPPSRRNVEELWTRVLKDITLGEVAVDKTVAELLQGHLGIPVRNKLLQKTLRQIANLSPSELDELYSELLLDLHQIRGLMAEKQLKIEKKPRPGGGFDVDVKEAGTRPVWWLGKGGREYAWISLDELP